MHGDQSAKSSPNQENEGKTTKIPKRNIYCKFQRIKFPFLSLYTTWSVLKATAPFTTQRRKERGREKKELNDKPRGNGMTALLSLIAALSPSPFNGHRNVPFGT